MSSGPATRIHGGTDALGAAAFDFSTNSNACGPCPAVMAALQAADATRYPDAGYHQLRQALADLHGVQSWRIVLAASGSEFIFRITAWAQRTGASRVWIPAQAYGDYASAASAWGLQRVQTQAEADLLWACEPSSPLGQAQGTWPSWLAQREADATTQSPGQTLVLDCAYAPLRLGGQPALNVRQRDQVWQVHSPNKALALTGIRAAYAIAPADGRSAVEQLNALAPSWPVGAHGEAMLLAWTQPAVHDWLAQTLPVLRAWKQTQVAMLQDLGWQCLPSDANFFCARPPAHVDLQTLLPLLRGQGIKLRDTTSMGMPGHVRLSAQPSLAQQALRSALTQAPTSGAAPAGANAGAPGAVLSQQATTPTTLEASQ